MVSRVPKAVLVAGRVPGVTKACVGLVTMQAS